MFDPNSFETELRDQTVTVEIVKYWPATPATEDEPPEDEDCTFEVYSSGGKLDLHWYEKVTISALAIEHLKWAAQEVELERRLSAMGD